MEVALIIIAVILFTCVFLNNLSERVGVPVLLMFILFGILVGTSDPEAINDYGELIGDICSIALVFVMFYGGFGTRYSVIICRMNFLLCLVLLIRFGERKTMDV